MAGNTMIHWLATAAKRLREEQRRKQVHIAAALSIDQSSVYRFEAGNNWPRDPDAMIAAYAEDLDIDDVREIWRLALELWESEGQAPDVTELLSPAARAGDPARPLREAARDTGGSRATRQQTRRASSRRSTGS
jgi:transcriptional regulator with XRE-family HTH domain